MTDLSHCYELARLMFKLNDVPEPCMYELPSTFQRHEGPPTEGETKINWEHVEKYLVTRRDHYGRDCDDMTMEDLANRCEANECDDCYVDTVLNVLWNDMFQYAERFSGCRFLINPKDSEGRARDARETLVLIFGAAGLEAAEAYWSESAAAERAARRGDRL